MTPTEMIYREPDPDCEMKEFHDDEGNRFHGYIARTQITSGFWASGGMGWNSGYWDIDNEFQFGFWDKKGRFIPAFPRHETVEPLRRHQSSAPSTRAPNSRASSPPYKETPHEHLRRRAMDGPAEDPVFPDDQ